MMLRWTAACCGVSSFKNDNFHQLVPGSGAPTWWVWPGENGQTPSGKWENDLQGAASSGLITTTKKKMWQVSMLVCTQMSNHFTNACYPSSTSQITFIATSSCSASCSIPKKRASSRTPKKKSTNHTADFTQRVWSGDFCDQVLGLGMWHCGASKGKTHPVYWCLHWWWADRVSGSWE